MPSCNYDCGQCATSNICFQGSVAFSVRKLTPPWKGQIPVTNLDDDKPAPYSRWHVKMVDNHRWHDTMKVWSVARSGHAAGYYLRSMTDGRMYYMFLSEFGAMVVHGQVKPGGFITGIWSFVKRGRRYGLALMGEGEEYETVPLRERKDIHELSTEE